MYQAHPEYICWKKARGMDSCGQPVSPCPVPPSYITWHYRRVNLRGVFLGCKYACAQFMKQDLDSSGRRGWIINVSSMLGYVGIKGGTGKICDSSILNVHSVRYSWQTQNPEQSNNAILRDGNCPNLKFLGAKYQCLGPWPLFTLFQYSSEAQWSSLYQLGPHLTCLERF